MSAEEIERRLGSMEQRLRIIEDIEEIKKLHVHYANCLTLTAPSHR